MAVTRFIWPKEVWLYGKHFHKNNEAAALLALCSLFRC